MKPRKATALVLGLGAVAGVAHALNWAATFEHVNPADPIRTMLSIRLLAGLILGPTLLWGARRILRRLVHNSAVLPAARERYLAWDAWTYTVVLVWTLGAAGIHLGWLADVLMVSLFLMAQLALLLLPAPGGLPWPWPPL